MKTPYIITSVVVLFSLTLPVGAQSTDPEFLQALTWMNSVGMTQYTTADLFRPNDRLMREQAAKFFVGFQQQRSGGVDDTTM